LLADDIAAVLSESGPVTASVLAERLGLSAGQVSFMLFASHGRFRCDTGSPPRWRLATTLSPRPSCLSQVGDDREQSPVPRPLERARPVPRPRPSASLGLYAWQLDALHAWEGSGWRGVIEAVTGTGKTMVGVAAALDELGRRGQVVVLVPTVELQHQWAAQFEARMSVLGRAGRMGAGARNSLLTHDILVAVVNSARAKDLRPVRRGGLLIADECHRYGSALNHLALDARFSRRLGLSATYARDDDGNLAWLDPYFGGTCFRLGYARAVADGIVARFDVSLVGVRFAHDEQMLYDGLSDEMKALFGRLVGSHGIPAQPFEAFMRAVATLADSDSAGSAVARAYLRAMRERRRLLAGTTAKDAAVSLLVPAFSAADRAIVFTQSIAVAERARRALAGCGLRAAAVHSHMASGDRAEVLRRFAAGQLDVLAAPRVLDEGIDVPAADLAVIVGASHTRRQMVQRMGRVLRRKPDGRHARFAVLFVEGTVEDPSFGGHEAFLEEVVTVADSVSVFSAEAVARQPSALLEALVP